MISIPLLKRELKANIKVLLIFVALITMYGSVIVAMFDPNLGNSLDMMAESMPELFAAFQMSSPGSTLIEFVGNYLYGFILIVVPLLAITLLSNRLISRYIDRGSMAYLLATPNTRQKIIVTQAFTLILTTLFLVIYAFLLILICGNLMFDTELDVLVLFEINAALFTLLLAVGGLNFLFSCIFNESKYTLGFGGGCTIFFVLVQMLSQVSDKLDFLQYLTPLTLFQVQDIIAQESQALVTSGILLVIGIVCYLAGIILFKKRDLPL